jgi:hypothetical protein
MKWQFPIIVFIPAAEEGLSLLLNEMCIRMGWSNVAQHVEEGHVVETAQLLALHPSGVSDLKDLLKSIGANSSACAAILHSPPKGLGIKR